MKQKVLSGNEAVALGAFESGVKIASAYPGTPSTEILENFARYEGIYAEWAPNEKVAMEVAAGASMTGTRVMTTMKHVGLNVAADPFMTLAYTGVKGGMLVVCADDPGMHSSQNEQDNRYYARLAQIPMLEPSDSQESRDMVGVALDISEKYDTMTMLRMTTRISHSKGIVHFDPDASNDTKAPEGFSRDARKFVMIPAYAIKRHPLVVQRVEKLKTLTEETKLNRIEWADRKVGVITNGISYQYVKEILPDASVLKIGMSYPLPENKIKDFASKVDRLFVVEELEPYMEDEIKIMGITVSGKEYFSRLGELTPDLVARGFEQAGVLEAVSKEPVSRPEGADMPRPPLMCAGCTHRGLFTALKKLKGIVHSDIGCYTLSVLPPLEAVDTTLCMGASISMAHGTAKAIEKVGIDDKRPVFAVLGDSTFFHSGITSLLDVIYNKSNVNVIILDNRITAMTGGQQNPGTGKTLQLEDTYAVDLLKLVEALGVERAREIGPFDLDGTIKALKEEAAFDGPSVLITREPCIQLLRQDPEKVRQVNLDECTGCGMCLRIGCPAIAPGDVIPAEDNKKERRYAIIDPSICRGCTVCEQVCKPGAIYQLHIEAE
ncbi:MAG: indolepyruvate ferredoxin oxidoreductase subunit alpha [Deltaproteobacteria bacterium]|nr:indolepyruvate ferredoxin oxidoreductase subunit alpha [Deltaproteobacteria bacterium]